MKRAIVFLLLFSIALSACDVDPYAGYRPIDDEGSVWESAGEDYYICFEVGNMKDSAMKIGDSDSFAVDFLWSQLDSGVTFYRYGQPEEQVLKGKCRFGESEFQIEVTSQSDCAKGLPSCLVFHKISS